MRSKATVVPFGILHRRKAQRVNPKTFDPAATRVAEAATPAQHLPWLDGLRGVAALWVLLHHTYILVGGSTVPLLSWGSLAVDLFMMLSGFLMVHNYLLRRAAQPWEDTGTWLAFWTKRWFRIAPLYYVLLALALVLGPWIGAQRDAIALAWPATATSPERYLDSSATNFLVHASFVFGFLPGYAYRSPLPDWSIGLEMQFYLVFPLVMLLLDRFGALRAGFAVVVACVLGKIAFPGVSAAFPMPSFLPIKLYVFLIGMWMGLSLAQRRPERYFWGGVLLALAACAIERSQESICRLLIVVLLFHLANGTRLRWAGRLAPGLESIKRVLSGAGARFLGDTSYGLYLLHLLWVIPAIAWLAAQPGFTALNVWVRWSIGLLLVCPVAYLGAWLLHLCVERPGIELGRRVTSVRRLKRRSA